jgi:hypothetical protein
MPKCEIISVSQARFGRLRCETAGALESFFMLQIPPFDQYLLSLVEQPNKPSDSKVLESRSGGLVFPATKPRGRILPTQPVIAWVCLGGFVVLNI